LSFTGCSDFQWQLKQEAWLAGTDLNVRLSGTYPSIQAEAGVTEGVARGPWQISQLLKCGTLSSALNLDDVNEARTKLGRCSTGNLRKIFAITS